MQYIFGVCVHPNLGTLFNIEVGSIYIYTFISIEKTVLYLVPWLP